MSDLGKRRAARDLWISRSHVSAALVGVFLLSSGSFAAGYLLGRGPATPRPASPESWSAQVPGEDLVALLARVEANRSTQGGVEALTFPDALAGVEPVQGPLDVQADPPGLDLEVPAMEVEAPLVGSPPVGAFTLRVGGSSDRAAADALLEDLASVADLTPWMGAEIVDGQMVYVVSVGGFASSKAADEALIGLAEDPRFADAEVKAIP